MNKILHTIRFLRIVITNNRDVKPLLAVIILFFCQCLSAQNKQITGTVTFADSSETALGATVSAKGTSIGTSTDKDGKYTLSVPESVSTLIFSFIGMKTVEEKIDGRSIINVVLADDLQQLQTTVITALGLKSERDKLTSSIATLKGSAVAQSGETGVLNGLSGKVAGVLVTRSGGDPG